MNSTHQQICDRKKMVALGIIFPRDKIEINSLAFSYKFNKRKIESTIRKGRTSLLTIFKGQKH